MRTRCVSTRRVRCVGVIVAAVATCFAIGGPPGPGTLAAAATPQEFESVYPAVRGVYREVSAAATFSVGTLLAPAQFTLNGVDWNPIFGTRPGEVNLNQWMQAGAPVHVYYGRTPLLADGNFPGAFVGLPDGGFPAANYAVFATAIAVDDEPQVDILAGAVFRIRNPSDAPPDDLSYFVSWLAIGPY